MLDCFITVVYDESASEEPVEASDGGKPRVFVYLTYSTYSEACRARDTMHGKYFGDSGVRVEAQLVEQSELTYRKKKQNLG